MGSHAYTILLTEAPSRMNGIKPAQVEKYSQYCTLLCGLEGLGFCLFVCLLVCLLVCLFVCVLHSSFNGSCFVWILVVV